MLEPLLIGAIVGGVLGAVLIGVIVTCIIHITKRLKKRTNNRAKLITSHGEVLDDKWAKDAKHQHKGKRDDESLYFGKVNETDHVMVKEKRKTEVEIVPPRRAVIIPPPPPPPPPPEPSPPLRSRRIYQSLTKDRTPPSFRRRPSFNADRPGGTAYFLYGIPYQQKSTTVVASGPTYGTTIQKTVPEPRPQPKKHLSLEEQERVLVVDDQMTELSFNPRWTGRLDLEAGGLATATGGTAVGVIEREYTDYTVDYTTGRKEDVHTGKNEPRIITEVI